MIDQKIREKIIISADDFGISVKANEKILELARLGKLDRVGVIIKGIFSSGELEELKNSGVALDIHFNVTDKFSLQRKLKESVAKRLFLFLLKYSFRKINSAKAKEEWEQQIKIFQKLLERNPDGINSHHHVHFFPRYFRVISKISPEYNIHYIRFGKMGLLYPRTGAAKIVNILWKLDSWLFRSFSFNSSDYWASADWTKDFNYFLKNLPEGKTELVFHPEREEEFELINKYF